MVTRSQPHVLFVFSGPPKQGTGSQIIIDRHLRRLTNQGWKVSIVVPEHTIIGEKFPDSWQLIPLPMRRWWWTPFRPQIPALLEFRLLCWQLECERILQNERPTAVLTVLWSVYASLAARLSKAWRIPLSVIIHDQQELWAQSDTERRLMQQCSLTTLNQATRVWSVSSELNDIYTHKAKIKKSVLLPIPEGNFSNFVEWRNSFKNPVLLHAGSLHSFQLPNLELLAKTLQKLDGTFLLIAQADNPVLLQLLDKYPNIKYVEPFKNNTEVINFSAANASCIVVSYSFDLIQQPWAVTSFPSKLAEFAHTGLPILLLAPPNTASANWAKNHHWQAFINKLNEENILYFLEQLTKKEAWLNMANQSRSVALNEFNPDLIQAQFEIELATIS